MQMQKYEVKVARRGEKSVALDGVGKKLGVEKE